jgi:uncharacterized membrane protein
MATISFLLFGSSLLAFVALEPKKHSGQWDAILAFAIIGFILYAFCLLYKNNSVASKVDELALYIEDKYKTVKNKYKSKPVVTKDNFLDEYEN